MKSFLYYSLVFTYIIIQKTSEVKVQQKTEEDLFCFYLVEVISAFTFCFCFCFFIAFSKNPPLNLRGSYEIMKARGSYSSMNANSSSSLLLFVKMSNL